MSDNFSKGDLAMLADYALGRTTWAESLTQAAYRARQTLGAEVVAPADESAQDARPESVTDDVWEALQRMIENAASLGPACQEDALLVARWRKRFIPAAMAKGD